MSSYVLCSKMILKLIVHRQQCGICGFVVGKVDGVWVSLAGHKCEDYLTHEVG